MVVHYVQNHGDAFFMTSIDKVLVILLGAVCLVHGKEIARVVSPTVITVKFLSRHQFNCIDTHCLQISQFVHGSVNIAGCGKITKKQFIDH